MTVTPHIAGQVVPETAAAGVVEELRRVRAGEAPRRLVDPRRGY